MTEKEEEKENEKVKNNANELMRTVARIDEENTNFNAQNFRYRLELNEIIHKKKNKYIN